MNKIFKKLVEEWQRERSKTAPLADRISDYWQYLCDFLLAKFYLLGKGAVVGPLPRLRHKPFIRNRGTLTIGSNFLLNSQFAQSHLVINRGGNIKIGDRVFINFGAAISSFNKITIGDRCNIGPHVMVMDNNFHAVGKGERKSGSSKPAEVEIGDDVWIASRVIILPGTKIGNGSVVAAGSVVRGIIPADVLVAGNPAKVIKSIAAAPAH